MKKILVVVDYQNDFVTGSLANSAAAALEQGIADKVQQILQDGGQVIFTRDTHEADYLATREGQFLPVPHCVRDTHAWHLYGMLAQYEAQPHAGVHLVDKPTFGAADLPQTVEKICGGAPDVIEICGVVTDICVVSNAILLHSHFLTAAIIVHQNLCAAVTPEGHRRALDLLAGMGYQVQ